MIMNIIVRRRLTRDGDKMYLMDYQEGVVEWTLNIKRAQRFDPLARPSFEKESTLKWILKDGAAVEVIPL